MPAIAVYLGRGVLSLSNRPPYGNKDAGIVAQPRVLEGHSASVEDEHLRMANFIIESK